MDDKMDKIMKAAVALFSEEGFFHTRTDDIAQRAGVSKGLVFHYFKSKQQLYSEAVNFSIDQMAKELDYNQFPRKSLLALFDYSVKVKFKIGEKYPQEIQLIMDAYSNLENLPPKLYERIMAYIDETKRQSYTVVARIIKNMPIRGDIHQEDVIKLVLMTFNQIEMDTRMKMAQQKVTDLHFFDELIAEAERLMVILENGFLEK